MNHERHGLDLVNVVVARIRNSDLRSPGRGPIPEGPHFSYELGESLFLGRKGRGPLEIAWDTNLLIDYFQYGRLLWDGLPLPDSIGGEHGEELEGLQLIISLWVLRDIRFHILRRTIWDSKRKPLSEDQRRRREAAWHEFCAAISLMTDEESEPSASSAGSAANVQPEEALSRLPEGNDRQLVADAYAQGAHVFMTCDKRVLSARGHWARHGLLLASPLDLLEELAACGALFCMLEPQYLYWPFPDLERVSHLIHALDA